MAYGVLAAIPTTLEKYCSGVDCSYLLPHLSKYGIIQSLTCTVLIEILGCLFYLLNEPVLAVGMWIDTSLVNSIY